jgi:hypothetical protein
VFKPNNNWNRGTMRCRNRHKNLTSVLGWMGTYLRTSSRIFLKGDNRTQFGWFRFRTKTRIEIYQKSSFGSSLRFKDLSFFVFVSIFVSLSPSFLHLCYGFQFWIASLSPWSFPPLHILFHPHHLALWFLFFISVVGYEYTLVFMKLRNQGLRVFVFVSICVVSIKLS